MRDICQRILEAGVENVLFMVPMRPLRTMLFLSYTSSDDPEVVVPCKIVEDRYKVSSGYKIEVVSIMPGFGRQKFYVQDLDSCLVNGRVEWYARMGAKP